MPSPRLAGQPKYLRRVKGGKIQARPYCPIERVRYNLGLFHTEGQAEAAIREFWRGRIKECPRYTRPVKHRDGRTTYIAEVNIGRVKERIGEYETREQAAAAVWGWHLGAYGRLYAMHLMETKGV